MEVQPGVWQLVLPMPDSFMRAVNLYLIRDHDGYVLIDCGLEIDESWQALTEQLDQLTVPIDAIHTIVCTHGHMDHYGLAARVREHSGAQILLHEREVPFMRYRYIDGDALQDMMVTWLSRYGFPPSEAGEMIKTFEGQRRESGVPAPDRLLEGGEELAIGPYRFEVLWTPGHTPGHISLLEARHRFLLVGDHILRDVAPNVSLQPYTDENPMAGYLSSLRHLRQAEIGLALPGHGEVFANLAERAQQLLGYQMDRRGGLLELVTPQPQTPYELASQVWATTTPQNWSQFRSALRRNAVGTLTAHLELLATEGLVARHEDESVRFARRS